MAKDGPNWEGLSKWSLSHSDGTGSTRTQSEEDRKWFMEAMQAQNVDVVKRMKEITMVMQTPEQILEAQVVTPADIEDLLAELQGHVESIDMVNALRDALESESVQFQRKALNLIHYLPHENSSDWNAVTKLGFPCILMHLASSENTDVREAALRGLLELARDKNKTDGASSRLVEEDEKLKQLLEERINGISLMSPKDLGAAREESQLVDSLWSTCYNEPSSL